MAYEELQRMVDESQRIVFFGGAGVSTESGIPDFRSVDGLYHQKYDWPPEEILSHTFFTRHTEDFYRFYRDKMLPLDAKPNPAHLKLAQWEREGKLIGIVTQNIDGLHHAAGSQAVFELHGTVYRNFCTKCGKQFGPEYVRDYPEVIPRCDACHGLIKPDVVLYEEGLDGPTLEGAVSAIQRADLLIVAGTSLTVYPAAGLIQYFRGKNLVLINRDATPMDKHADLIIRDKVGQVLGSLS
ncbi:MAG: NAD-dependent protein deacylase [Clostridia bacterium]|nr:NAD-dependent protein deacylase [Clostridia bacterium]